MNKKSIPFKIMLLALCILVGACKKNDIKDIENLSSLRKDSINLEVNPFGDFMFPQYLDYLSIPDSCYKINLQYDTIKRLSKLSYFCARYEDDWAQILTRYTYFYRKNRGRSYAIEYLGEDGYRTYIGILHNKAFVLKWSENILPRECMVHDLLETWDLFKTATEIKTSLDKNTLYCIYPNFKGVYIYDSTRTISIDNSININSEEFYDSIKFIK